MTIDHADLYAPHHDREPHDLPAADFTALGGLFDGIGELIDAVLGRSIWAEEEIEAAQRRHGERDRGPLWQSFRLLRHTHEREWPELVFRAHCRELLDRVAAGHDTRPATDAEKLAVLSVASQTAPLNGGAETLYLRIGARMFPDIFDEVCDVLDVQAYEKVHGSRADEYEADLARKLAQPWRRADATSEQIDQLLIPLHV